MKKRFPYLILPTLTLILEILPYGAVCIFAPSPTETIRKTFSYFNLIPFGYANFSPLITALTTCLIFILLTIYFIGGNIRTAIASKNILFIAVALSLGSLFYGIDYYSLFAGFITLSLTAELILLCFLARRSSSASE